MGLISRVSSRTYRNLITMPYEALKEHLENHKQYDYDPRFRGYNRVRECAWNYGDYFRCEFLETEVMTLLHANGLKSSTHSSALIKKRRPGTTSEKLAFSGEGSIK